MANQVTISDDIVEALEYLRVYQAWRRGHIKKSITDINLDPAKIGVMLDRVLDFFDVKNPEIKCNDCIYKDPASVVTGCSIEAGCSFTKDMRRGNDKSRRRKKKI